MVETKPQPQEDEPPLRIEHYLEVKPEYSNQAAEILREHGVPFIHVENTILEQDEDDTNESGQLYIEAKLYNQIKQFCEILGVTLETFTNNVIGKFPEMLEDQPLDVIDEYREIEKIDNIYEMLVKINEIVDIDLEIYKQLKDKRNLHRSEFGVLEIKENGSWKCL